MKEAIKNRYEFVVLFDVENGNPNGDPDAGNMPRIDPETNLGIITDVCLKRKIRSFVETVKEDASGYRIYIKDGVPLNRSDNEAFLRELGIPDAASLKPEDLKKAIKNSGKNVDVLIRDFMVDNFFDIRAFGAVMTTMVKGNLNCGQIRGPVQFSFARSVDPVIPQEITITRVAITTEADADKKNTNLINSINTVINVAIGLIGFVAVVVIIYGGFQYTTSAGDAAKVKKAKDTIMYGVIGLVVALLAFAIVNFILSDIIGA